MIAWGMFDQELGRSALYVKFTGTALSRFDLLSTSAISARADTKCRGLFADDQAHPVMRRVTFSLILQAHGKNASCEFFG